MKNHVYLAAAISLSCATVEPSLETGEVSEAGLPVAAPAPEQAAPTAEEIETRIAERMATAAEEQRARTAALPSVTGPMETRTRVQEAIGGYSDCFGELPAPRRACRRRFNRLMSETRLIR